MPMYINKLFLTILVMGILTIFVFCSVYSYPSSDWIIISSLNNNNIFFYYDKNLIEQYPVITNEGRYHILNGLHLNVALILSNLEIKRLFIGFLQGAIYILFCYILFINTNKNKSILSIVLFFSFTLSQQFLYPFLHPALEESLFSLFISLILCLVSKNNDKNRFLYLFLFLFLLLLLILAKITSLLIIVGYLLSSIFFYYFKKIKFNKVHLYIFIGSLVLWFYLFILTNGQVTSEDKTRFFEFHKYLFLYINTDPLLFLILFFILYNINTTNKFLFERNIEKYNFFNAGLLYFICLIMTGKHSQYHVLPVYVCFLPVFFIHIENILENTRFSFFELIISLALLIFYLFANIKIIFILNIIIILYINIYYFKFERNNKKLILFNIFTFLIFIIFIKRSHNFTQILFCILMLFFIYKDKNFKSIYHVIILILLIFISKSYLSTGFITTYYHFKNQKAIINIATIIHQKSSLDTRKKVILFDLDDAKPEDVVNHAYILAKTISSVYGDTIRIMPKQCKKIPEIYDSIRYEQTLRYARDFDSVLIPCLADSLEKFTDYSFVNVYATNDNFFNTFFSKFSVYNPNQLILSHH
jgi:hypothetical protein